MVLVYEDKKRRVIRDQEKINFSSFSSFHLIIITARAKGEKQISSSATDDEDLKVKIDDKSFPTDSPAAFSGGSLHNLVKTVYFLTFLKGKSHTITLETDKPSHTATFESLEVYTLNLEKTLTLKVKNQAEDGDRRPWITFVLSGLSLSTFTVELTLKRRFIDSDDIKVIIDGEVKRNNRSVLHKFWYFIASLFTGETQVETFTENLPLNLHYIEFWADRMPTIHKVKIDLGEVDRKRTPTVNDPQWTEDFSDDSNQIILARAIFGEARSELLSDQARIAVGWSIRNRVEDPRWGDTYQAVVTQDKQYSAFNKTDDNRPYVENPFWRKTESDKAAWYKVYEIAGKIIGSEVKDPTNGANHYYDSSIPAPYWATKETLVLTVKSLDNKLAMFFHRL